MPQTGLQTRQTGRIRRGCGQHLICWATWAGPACRFRRVWPPCSTGWPSARPESCWGWMQRNPGSSGRKLCQRRQIRQLTKLSSHPLWTAITLTNCNLIRIHLLLNVAARTRHSGRVSAAEREESMQARTCLLSAFTLGSLAVFASLPARAQDADEQALKAANAAFYAALTSRNEAAMDPLWVHAPYVAVMHPDSKAPIIGWEAVRQSFV